MTVLELALQAASLGNVNAISDAGTGAALARAALTGAGLNVRVNVLNLADQAAVQGFLNQMVELESSANRIEAQLKQVLAERGQIKI